MQAPGCYTLTVLPFTHTHTIYIYITYMYIYFIRARARHFAPQLLAAVVIICVQFRCKLQWRRPLLSTVRGVLK